MKKIDRLVESLSKEILEGGLAEPAGGVDVSDKASKSRFLRLVKKISKREEINKFLAGFGNLFDWKIHDITDEIITKFKDNVLIKRKTKANNLFNEAHKKLMEINFQLVSKHILTSYEKVRKNPEVSNVISLIDRKNKELLKQVFRLFNETMDEEDVEIKNKALRYSKLNIIPALLTLEGTAKKIIKDIYRTKKAALDKLKIETTKKDPIIHAEKKFGKGVIEKEKIKAEEIKQQKAIINTKVRAIAREYVNYIKSNVKTELAKIKISLNETEDFEGHYNIYGATAIYYATIHKVLDTAGVKVRGIPHQMLSHPFSAIPTVVVNQTIDKISKLIKTKTKAKLNKLIDKVEEQLKQAFKGREDEIEGKRKAISYVIEYNSYLHVQQDFLDALSKIKATKRRAIDTRKKGGKARSSPNDVFLSKEQVQTGIHFFYVLATSALDDLKKLRKGEVPPGISWEALKKEETKLGTKLPQSIKDETPKHLDRLSSRIQKIRNKDKTIKEFVQRIALSG